MVSLICVRHGQSRANERKIFTGQTDVPLSALGERQAERLEEYLLANYRIDAVCSSDLRRAYDTVAPVAAALGIPVRKVPALREICGGAWEEKTAEEIARLFPDDYRLWREDIGECRCTGGESVAEVQARAVAAVRAIVSENEGKTVLIGAHACVLRTLQCFWQHIPLSRMKEIAWVPNASVTQVDYQTDGIWRIVRLGDVSFQQGEVTRISQGF